jgi:hypothetical protein
MQGERLRKNQEDILERKYGKFVRADTTSLTGASMPGRMILGLLLLREIDKMTTTGPSAESLGE